MTDAEWPTSTDPQAMLTFLRDGGKLTDRNARLFAAACCRRIWNLWAELPGERQAVEVTESYAEGLATWGEMEAAGGASEPVPLGGQGEGGAGHNCTRRDAWDAARVVSGLVAEAAGSLGLPGGEGTERQAETALLRDIFGDPFAAPPRIDPAWLAWDGGTIPRLAEAAYQERALPSGELDRARLAVLADALEEAGCTDEALLGHLRGPGPCVRGCHVVDLLTGREAPP